MEVRRISDALKVRASHQANEIAHDDTRRQISFAEWDREADEVGGGLAAAGLVPGDRVFLPISNARAVEMAIAEAHQAQHKSRTDTGPKHGIGSADKADTATAPDPAKATASAKAAASEPAGAPDAERESPSERT